MKRCAKVFALAICALMVMGAGLMRAGADAMDKPMNMLDFGKHTVIGGVGLGCLGFAGWQLYCVLRPPQGVPPQVAPPPQGVTFWDSIAVGLGGLGLLYLDRKGVWGVTKLSAVTGYTLAAAGYTFADALLTQVSPYASGREKVTPDDKIATALVLGGGLGLVYRVYKWLRS